MNKHKNPVPSGSNRVIPQIKQVKVASDINTAGSPQPQRHYSVNKFPNKNLACKKCNLIFADVMNFKRHMIAHAKQANSGLQVSDSTGQAVNLGRLVKQIKTEPLAQPRSSMDVIKKLSSLKGEITLQPVQKKARMSPSNGGGGLGLVISSVQSVSQSFFDDLERKPQLSSLNKKIAMSKPFLTKIPTTTNGFQNTVTVKRDRPPNNWHMTQKRDASGRFLKKPSSTPSTSGLKEDTRTAEEKDPLAIEESHEQKPDVITPPKLKNKGGRPLRIKTEPETLSPNTTTSPSTSITSPSGTRRSGRVNAFNEADQPKYEVKFYKAKGKTYKRRIFPCGKCKCKFENMETRKMHFVAVHMSSINVRSCDFLEAQKPPALFIKQEKEENPTYIEETPILPELTPLIKEENDILPPTIPIIAKQMSENEESDASSNDTRISTPKLKIEGDNDNHIVNEITF